MCHQSEVVCTVLLVCVIGVLSGPLKTSTSQVDKKSEVPATRVNDQELALEELAELAAKSHKNVAVQKEKTYYYTNVNGKVNSDSTSEEKILDPVKQELVLDLQKETKGDNKNGEPHEVTVDKIDMPAAGLHKSLVSNGDDTEINDVTDESEQISSKTSDIISFTPEAVAEFLLETGEFEEFDQGLKELENSSGMTHEEAEEYKNSVREAYNKLYQEAEAEAQSETAIEESFFPETVEDMPSSYDSLPASFYNMFNDESRIPSLDMEELQNEATIPDVIAEKETLNTLIEDLMDEWLSRAVLTGDQKAGAMLNNIMSVVSKDQDPDDFRQVRQILTDLVADEVLQGLQPRQEIPMEYEDMLGTQFLPSIPQPIVNEIPGMIGSADEPQLAVESLPAKKSSAKDDTTSQQSDENSGQKNESVERPEPSKEEMQKLKM
ncbi:uncharacterized protein LOC110454489 [Mizuhopecten yessoensis]|uniref:Uncharacterized protein n=1 Tax=Mizuhopecten yessoensis TaxID=6573 RepID=A0A210QF24_MIZYE|nr:uncharacterized protein LOC110454489 [Mizuhopecten yessoensis]OWF47335.1 hypothetical protein KP79_PYT22604 [Mizuhopecten yessoensis]